MNKQQIANWMITHTCSKVIFLLPEYDTCLELSMVIALKQQLYHAGMPKKKADEAVKYFVTARQIHVSKNIGVWAMYFTTIATLEALPDYEPYDVLVILHPEATKEQKNLLSNIHTIHPSFITSNYTP